MTERAWRLDSVGAHSVPSEIEEAAQVNPRLSTAPIEPAGRPAGDERGRMAAGFLGRCNQLVRAWASVQYRRLRNQTESFEAGLHDWVGTIQTAHDSRCVEAALIRHAQRIVPAYRIELVKKAELARDGAAVAHDHGTASGDKATAARRGHAQDGQTTLELPIRCGSVPRAWLRIRPRGQGVARLRQVTIQRLNTLCTIGACALERLDLHEEWPERGPLPRPTDSPPPGPSDDTAQPCDSFANIAELQDATFLNAVLPFAINQARRHNEPLSFICVAIDRLASIQELLGRAAVDQLIKKVGETVASMIRESDIVARLDDDRIVAVLPRAPGGGALHVAQNICKFVAATIHDDCDVPNITVSIGVATFPTCADNVYSLFDAADEALAQAQNQGRNQAYLAPRQPPAGPPTRASGHATPAYH